MTPTSADNVTGAFTPHDITQKNVDTVKREQSHETLVPSKRGVGLSAAYGTFINLTKSKWGVNRFFKTAPVAALPLQPKLPGYLQQVQNPATLNMQPGYVNSLNSVQTQLGRMAERGNSGVLRG